MKKVGRQINPDGTRWVPDARHIRCQEHVLNLAAQHFVDGVSPTPQAALMRKICQAVDDGNDAELNTLTQELASMEVDNDNNDGTSFNAGDSLGKALALIEQIQKSPRARAFFQKACQEENVPQLELLQWAVNCFMNLTDKSKEVPTLRNKSYNDFKLDRADWKHLTLIHQVLKEPATAQQSFSSAKHPTAWCTIPTLECLADRWRSMAADVQYTPIADAIQQGLKNIDKYFKKSSESNVYFICLVLNPNYKLAYIEGRWHTQEVATGRACLEAVFNDYYMSPSPTNDQSAPLMRPTHTQYGDDWMCEAIKMHQMRDHLTHNLWQELTAYLSSALEYTNDIVVWWGLHLLQYPTLARWSRLRGSQPRDRETKLE
ncbi:ribonuclease H-like domain-containing protein [Suillus fuscotomentosus]|uniref:Ribonuclease H-like domain-containing protein n=1 Tax=Suillus fuscotomentosus TaxID=1912939 RepID=A0AAD4HKK5_9AGAM|nr:ribonuclease H-like domain-containing protein [Suillus fuscotomentosus]KAG1901095.1 ribonuclease H-like domain-containing protein [Suillus fuscotomentosus]